MLWAKLRRRFWRMRILLLGVLPEFRGKGIDALMWHRIWSNCELIGIRWAEAGWILEDNALMNNALERMGFRVYRRYRVYQRTLSAATCRAMSDAVEDHGAPGAQP